MPLAVLMPAPEKNTLDFDDCRDFAIGFKLFIFVDSRGDVIRKIYTACVSGLLAKTWLSEVVLTLLKVWLANLNAAALSGEVHGNLAGKNLHWLPHRLESSQCWKVISSEV